MFIILLIAIVHCEYINGQYKQDIDDMATDVNGQLLIKQLRQLLKKTHDQSEVLIHLNLMESDTSAYSIDEYHEACDQDLINIGGIKKEITEAKFRIADNQIKIKRTHDNMVKFQELVDEKAGIISDTEAAMADLESMREKESQVFDLRRNQLMLANAIVRRSKYLIGSLIPNYPGLAAQTKFAKTDSELNFKDSMVQLNSQAESQLGKDNPFTQILSSLAQKELEEESKEDESGTLGHVSNIVNVMAIMEDDLTVINNVLFTAEEQRNELFERMSEQAQQTIEILLHQSEQLEQVMKEAAESIDQYQAEIDDQVTQLEQLNTQLEDYFDIHEKRRITYKESLQDQLLRIKLIRIVKEDLTNEFNNTRHYLLSQRFHFKN